MTQHQCGKVWKRSPTTGHHPPALWRINNWQMIWTSSTAGLKKHPTPALNTSPHNPPLPHTCNSDQWKRGAPGLPEAEKEKSTRPRLCHTGSVWNPVLTSWPPSSQISSTDNWNCPKSPHASNAPPCIIPIPNKSKTTGLNGYRPVALTSVVMKSFEKLVLAQLKDITGPSLDPLQFAYRANRSVDDAVNMGLLYVLQHLDRPEA